MSRYRRREEMARAREAARELEPGLPRERRAAAGDPATAPGRLRRLALLGCGREVAGNPNAPADLLLRLAGRYFEEFLGNPVLALLLLEDPGFCLKIPTAALRRLLRRRDVPATFLQTLLRHPEAEVRDGARLHVGAGGEVRDAAATAVGEARSPVEPLPELLELGILPTWLLEPLAGSRRAGLRELAIAALEAAGDPLGALYRRAGAGAPRPGKPARAAGDLTAEEMARLARGGPWARHLAALHPQTPGDLLRGLCRDREPEIRCAALRHPCAPEEELWAAAGAGDAARRLAVARNVRAPEGVLERLAGDADAGVRRAALRNPGASAAVVARLAGDADAEVRRCVGAHPLCPPSVLETLAGDVEARVRAVVARHACLPAAAAARLAADESSSVRAVIAGRVDLDREILIALFTGDPDHHVRFRAHFNRAHPQDLIQELMHLADPADVRKVFARWPQRVRRVKPPGKPRAGAYVYRLPCRHYRERLPEDEWNGHHSIALKTTDGDDLHRLAESANHSVLEAVAGNKHTRAETFARLFANPARTWRMYGEAAGNPNLSLERLEWLAGLDHPNVSNWIGWSKTAPVELIARVAESKHENVRSAAAHNARTPLAVLERLAGDPSAKVRKALITNDAAPWRLLEPLLPEVERDSDLRGRLARRGALPPEWRERLLADPVVAVRIDFAHNPALTPEEFARLEADPEPSVREELLAGVHRWPAEIFEMRVRDADPGPLARSPKCPPEILERLAEHPDAEVRKSVACNAATPPAAQVRLAGDAEHEVRLAILSNASITEEALDRFFDCHGVPQDNEIFRVLTCKRLSPAHYDRLLAEGGPEIAQRIAGSEHTPMEVLRRVVKDAPKGALYHIARERRLPMDVLEMILEGADAHALHNVATAFLTPWEFAERVALEGDLNGFFERRTRAILARRRDASGDFLLRLLERELTKPENSHRGRRYRCLGYEERFHVLVELVRRPEVPVERLESLLASPDQRVRRALLARADLPGEWRDRLWAAALERALERAGFARLAALAHPETPEGWLRKFAEKGSWLERCAVARNPSLPGELRARLGEDANAAVRAAAAGDGD